MQTLAIERTRVQLQLSTENASFKSSEIALLKQLEMRYEVLDDERFYSRLAPPLDEKEIDYPTMRLNL